ncbi:MAG: adenine deaminase [Chitinivibrionia bacterium]|nr:adenine deaminase [Chitinivibrionia bacterium]
MNENVMKTMLQVAKGNEPPDSIIRNGKIVNVFTSEIQEGLAVTIKEGRIAVIDEDSRVAGQAGVKEIDAGGRYLCPGFIDAHTHLDATYSFGAFVPYALKGGTTSAVTECGMAGNSCGMEGIETFIESTRGYPFRCYFVAPPLMPPFPALEGSTGITLREFGRLLKREDFLGVGEAYWTRIVEGDDRVVKQAALAMALGKRLDGHSSGARGNRLNQYVLTGITSCHESVSLDEAVEKLRLGLYVMIREGFVRRELKELSKLKDLPVDMRRLILTTDTFDPVMLIEEGYLDSVARRAIEYGFSPMDAIRMVSINVADYCGLRFQGAIAPLRYADILFLSSLEEVIVEDVMQNGEFVVSGGRFIGHPTPYEYPEKMLRTLTVEKVTPEDFRIKAPGTESAKVRLLELRNETIVTQSLWKAPVESGFLRNDPAADVVYAAVINRRDRRKMGKGLVKGTGIKSGAIATTIIWDTCNILVVGSDENEMAHAVNELLRIQGGIVITQEGRVIYSFPMPAYGTVPLGNMPELKEKVLLLDEAMKKIGTFTMPRPFLTIQTIPFTGLPFFRITDKGLADMKAKKLVSLFVKEE